MSDQVTLFTSLQPNLLRSIRGEEVGPSYQRECVNSWRRAGFNVASLNCAAEIDELAAAGYEVDYFPVAGKIPLITDFISAIYKSDQPVAGIINGDCYLSTDSQSLLAILRQAATGMVLFERLNLDPIATRPTGRSCNGFDAFVFKTEMLPKIEIDRDLTLGQPWWDYWFPVAGQAAGYDLMTASGPLLFHLDHNQKWDQEQWISNGIKFVEHFRSRSTKLPDAFVAQLQQLPPAKALDARNLGPFSFWCLDWLRERSKLQMPSNRNANPLRYLITTLDDPLIRELFVELDAAKAQAVGKEDAEGKLKSAERTHAAWEAHAKGLETLLTDAKSQSALLKSLALRIKSQLKGFVGSLDASLMNEDEFSVVAATLKRETEARLQEIEEAISASNPERSVKRVMAAYRRLHEYLVIAVLRALPTTWKARLSHVRFLRILLGRHRLPSSSL